MIALECPAVLSWWQTSTYLQLCFLLPYIPSPAASPSIQSFQEGVCKVLWWLFCVFSLSLGLSMWWITFSSLWRLTRQEVGLFESFQGPSGQVWFQIKHQKQTYTLQNGWKWSRCVSETALLCANKKSESHFLS